MKKKDRLSLEFSEGTKDSFEKLKEKCGASSISEVVRRALVIYEYLLDQQKSGGRIITEHPDRPNEVIRVF